MGIGDLFKSTKELEREKNRARRRALRDVERAADVVKDRIATLKKERDAAWAQARDYLRDGQKAAAQRCLQSVQANELMMGKLERKSWVFGQLSTKMEMAKTDQEFASALANLNTTLEIDPDKIAEALDDTNDSLSEQGDIDKIWDKEYGKEMNGLAQSDSIPSVEDMMASLEKEVVADVSGGKSVAGKVATAGAEAVGNVAEAIGEGRRKLKALMEAKK